VQENPNVYLSKIIRVEITRIDDQVDKMNFVVRAWETDTVEIMRRVLEMQYYEHLRQILVLTRNNKATGECFLRDVESLIYFKVMRYTRRTRRCNVS